MAITNGYATLAEFKAHRAITSLSAVDDSVAEILIGDASRMIDAVCGRWFYAATLTRYLNVVNSRALDLGEDCLTITTLTNGDGTVVTTADYYLDPRNHPVKTRAILKQSSAVMWLQDTDGNDENAITAAGTWGYCDRTATDPYSAAVISNTRRACLEIANQLYQERSGANMNGSVQVTGAGIVITPYGAVPKVAYDLIKPYIKPVYATTGDLNGYVW